MRLNRILYITLLSISFIFVYYYDGKVPYMFFYTVLILPVVSFLQMIAGYFTLIYNQTIENDSITKGDCVTLKVNIVNKSFIFLPYIKINFFYDKGGVIENYKLDNILIEKLETPTNNKIVKSYEVKNILAKPFSKRELSFNYKYKYRGYFKFGVSSIEVQDFLGIFKITKKNKNPLFIRVYPQIIEIDKFSLANGNLTDNTLNFKGVQEDISTIEDINKYSYGDSLKKIHWKLSAKTNELMVKEYEKATSLSVLFILNLEVSDALEEKRVFIEDKYIETVIAVLRYFSNNGVETKVLYDEGEINILQCNNSFNFLNVYEVLSKVEFNQKRNLEDIINSEISYNTNKGDLIIATSKLDYKLYETLYKVRLDGYEISLIYISDKEITQEKEESKEVIELLSKLKIKVYSINLTDDIKEIFK